MYAYLSRRVRPGFSLCLIVTAVLLALVAGPAFLESGTVHNVSFAFGWQLL